MWLTERGLLHVTLFEYCHMPGRQNIKQKLPPNVLQANVRQKTLAHIVGLVLRYSIFLSYPTQMSCDCFSRSPMMSRGGPDPDFILHGPEHSPVTSLFQLDNSTLLSGHENGHILVRTVLQDAEKITQSHTKRYPIHLIVWARLTYIVHHHKAKELAWITLQFSEV